MKILVIGDFHGKFPINLQKKIKKIKPDLILSPGDFCGNKEYISLFFKHSYGKDIELWEAIGKKRTKELELKSRDAGLKIIKKLNSFNVPVIVVTGNQDITNGKDIGWLGTRSEWELVNKDLFRPSIKKFEGVKVIDHKLAYFKKINFIGYPKSSYPGKPVKELKGENYDVEKINRDYKRYYSKYSKLFKEARKNKKPIIFLVHNAPYMTKIDKIKSKKAHKLVREKHYGSYLTKQLIKRYQPLLCVCGHMHEYQGTCKIGRTMVINAGPAYKGKAALIELEKGKVKKTKFLR